MRLREIRKREGHTTVSAAKALCVSQPTYNTWELGTREPNIEKILALCQLLKTSPNELLGYEPAAPAPTIKTGDITGNYNVVGSHNTIVPPTSTSPSTSPSTARKRKAKSK